MTTPTYPLTVAVYWGTFDPEGTASSVTFDSALAQRGYQEGIQHADGWFDAHFVAHPDFKVNGDGDFIEGKRKTAVNDTDRFVIWGEHPEKGTVPDTFSFETVAEAEGFQQGVEDSVGWSKVFFVPDASFQPSETYADALELLPDGEARAALEAWMDREGLDPHDGPIFVRKDGSFVREDWEPAGPIFNEYLEPAAWNAVFETRLRDTYGKSLDDVGLDAAGLGRARAGQERDPMGAAADFADQHGLAPIPYRAFKP